MVLRMVLPHFGGNNLTGNVIHTGRLILSYVGGSRSISSWTFSVTKQEKRKTNRLFTSLNEAAPPFVVCGLVISSLSVGWHVRRSMFHKTDDNNC